MKTATAALEFHEVADIFPLMEGDNFRALVDDIREHGLREPITLHDGKILDGRNRYRACLEAGTDPTVREWDEEGTPEEFVISTNIHRRHLTQSQLSIVGAKLQSRFEADAKRREYAGVKQGTNGNPPANLPEGTKGDSRDKAAAVVGVSGRSVDAGSKVLKNGVPELVEAVEKGKVKVSAASAVSSLPAAEQKAVVAKGPKAVKAKAKAVRDSKVNGNGAAKARPAKTPPSRRDVFDKLLSDINVLIGTVNGGPEAFGWGGIRATVEGMTPSEIKVARARVVHTVGKLNEWVEALGELMR